MKIPDPRAFVKQQSTTYTMPSIVTLVSATLDATTTFLAPLGAAVSACSCITGGRPAYSGKTTSWLCPRIARASSWRSSFVLSISYGGE